jgi:molybdopterin biosynthesis enzyme
MRLKNIGMIITGSEIFKGRIKDGFSPVLHRKIEALGCVVNNEEIVPDDADIIAKTIQKFKAQGSEVILCCSGMSVDPDDVTPTGIRKSGADVRFYGLPVLAGAMFLYAKLDDVHVLGVPACVLHAPTTAFDALFPIVLTGEELSFAGTRGMGHGGLCLKCPVCAYPICPYCK